MIFFCVYSRVIYFLQSENFLKLLAIKLVAIFSQNRFLSSYVHCLRHHEPCQNFLIFAKTAKEPIVSISSLSFFLSLSLSLSLFLYLSISFALVLYVFPVSAWFFLRHFFVTPSATACPSDRRFRSSQARRLECIHIYSLYNNLDEQISLVEQLCVFRGGVEKTNCKRDF